MSANVAKNKKDKDLKNIKIAGMPPTNEPRRSTRVKILEEKKKTEAEAVAKAAAEAKAVAKTSGITKPPRKQKQTQKQLDSSESSDTYAEPQLLEEKYNIPSIIEKHKIEHTKSRENIKSIEHYIHHIKEIFYREKQSVPQLQYLIYQSSWDYIFKNLGSNAETILNTSKYLENPYSTAFIHNEGEVEYIINYSCNDENILKRIFKNIDDDFIKFNNATDFKLISGHVSFKVFKYTIIKDNICVANIKFINDPTFTVSKFINHFIEKPKKTTNDEPIPVLNKMGMFYSLNIYTYRLFSSSYNKIRLNFLLNFISKEEIYNTICTYISIYNTKINEQLFIYMMNNNIKSPSHDLYISDYIDDYINIKFVPILMIGSDLMNKYLQSLSPNSRLTITGGSLYGILLGEKYRDLDLKAFVDCKLNSEKFKELYYNLLIYVSTLACALKSKIVKTKYPIKSISLTNFNCKDNIKISESFKIIDVRVRQAGQKFPAVLISIDIIYKINIVITNTQTNTEVYNFSIEKTSALFDLVIEPISSKKYPSIADIKTDLYDWKPFLNSKSNSKLYENLVSISVPIGNKKFCQSLIDNTFNNERSFALRTISDKISKDTQRRTNLNRLDNEPKLHNEMKNAFSKINVDIFDNIPIAEFIKKNINKVAVLLTDLHVSREQPQKTTTIDLPDISSENAEESPRFDFSNSESMSLDNLPDLEDFDDGIYAMEEDGSSGIFTMPKNIIGVNSSAILPNANISEQLGVIGELVGYDLPEDMEFGGKITQKNKNNRNSKYNKK